MRKEIWLGVLALAACTIPVNLGSGPRPDGGETSSRWDPCAPAVSAGKFSRELKAYSVTLAETAVTSPACWSDGQVPMNNIMAEQTFSVVVLTVGALLLTDDGATLGVDQLPAQRLGDLPPIEISEAMAGVSAVRTPQHRFRATNKTTNLGGVVESSATFAFDRLDTEVTSGHLALSSTVWGRTSGEMRRCEVVRPLIARASAIPPRWLQPTTPRLEGASLFLVSLDFRFLDGHPPTPRRSLEVWQANGETVRVPPRAYALKSVPPVEVESDFGVYPNNIQVRTQTNNPNDVRTTSAVLDFGPRCLHDSLDLSSSDMSGLTSHAVVYMDAAQVQ